MRAYFSILISFLLLIQTSFAFEGNNSQRKYTSAKSLIDTYVRAYAKAVDQFVKEYDAHKSDYRKLLENDKRFSWVLSEIGNSNPKLPSISIINNKYQIKSGKYKLSFDALDLYKKQFVLNGRVLPIETITNPEKLKEIFKVSSNLNPFDLIIPKANAGLGVAIIIVLAIVVMAAIGFKGLLRSITGISQKDFMDELSKTKTQCQNDLGQISKYKRPMLDDAVLPGSEVVKKTFDLMNDTLNNRGTVNKLKNYFYKKLEKRISNGSGDNCDKVLEGVLSFEEDVKKMCDEVSQIKDCLDNYKAIHDSYKDKPLYYGGPKYDYDQGVFEK